MVVTFSDSEEHVIQKIMDVLRDEPAVEHSLEPSYVSNVLTSSGLVVHMKEQTVYQNGEEVSLTHHEFFTLAYLIQHPGWVFSKEQIYEEVWKENPEHCGAAVANVISQIRRKLGEGYIKTVIGSGYKFEQ
ncbi:MAG: winged helix-turn-helix transcriptional regulator [Lachnospiraceae bacterium]|nr:winged helix-turn-helix transcriptional regulator [Lachnospiraceae bacterium]